MKKTHIVGLAFIGLGAFALLTESDKEKAEKAGFGSVSAYERALKAGFETKQEYDAHLERIKLEERARDNGFPSVESMQSAESRGFSNRAEEEKAADAGFSTKEEFDNYLEQEKLKRTAERGGFASVVAMQDARQRGFFTAAAEQEAAAVGAKTKAEYDEYKKQKKFEALLTAKSYGLINTQMTKGFNFDAFAGKSCTAVVNALLRTPSKSGDFLVIGTFADLRNGEVVSAATEVKPKTDCEKFFGFSCKDYRITSSNFDIYVVGGLLRATENRDQMITYNYDKIETGYVDYEISNSPEYRRKMNLPSTQSGKSLLCVDP